MKSLQRFFRYHWVILATWIFMGGGLYATVQAQSHRIDKLESQTQGVNGDIREIKEAILWIKESFRNARR